MSVRDEAESILRVSAEAGRKSRGVDLLRAELVRVESYLVECKKRVDVASREFSNEVSAAFRCRDPAAPSASALALAEAEHAARVEWVRVTKYVTQLREVVEVEKSQAAAAMGFLDSARADFVGGAERLAHALDYSGRPHSANMLAVINPEERDVF